MIFLWYANGILAWKQSKTWINLDECFGSLVVETVSTSFEKVAYLKLVVYTKPCTWLTVKEFGHELKNAVVVWGCRRFKNSSRACFLLDSTATLTLHNDCSCPASAWDMGQTPDRLVCPSSGAGSSIVCISRHIVTKPFQISRTRV